MPGFVPALQRLCPSPSLLRVISGREIGRGAAEEQQRSKGAEEHPLLPYPTPDSERPPGWFPLFHQYAEGPNGSASPVTRLAAATVTNHPAWATKPQLCPWHATSPTTAALAADWDATCMNGGLVRAAASTFAISGALTMRYQQPGAEPIIQQIARDILAYVDLWQSPPLSAFFSDHLCSAISSGQWSEASKEAIRAFLPRAVAYATSKSEQGAPWLLHLVAGSHLGYHCHAGNAVHGRITGNNGTFKCPTQWYLLFLADALDELLTSSCPPRLHAHSIDSLLPQECEIFGEFFWDEFRQGQCFSLLNTICNPGPFPSHWATSLGTGCQPLAPSSDGSIPDMVPESSEEELPAPHALVSQGYRTNPRKGPRASFLVDVPLPSDPVSSARTKAAPQQQAGDEGLSPSSSQAFNPPVDAEQPTEERRPISYQVAAILSGHRLFTPPSSKALHTLLSTYRDDTVKEQIAKWTRGLNGHLRFFKNAADATPDAQYRLSHGDVTIVPTRALVDDGATTEVISNDLALRLGLRIFQTAVQLSTSTASNNPVLGVCEPVSIHYGTGLTVMRPCLVVEGMGDLYEILVSNQDFLTYKGQTDELHSSYKLRLDKREGGREVILPTINRRT